MSNKAPLPNSANRTAQAPAASPAGDTTPKILALLATAAAAVIAFLVKDPQYIAGAALVGTVLAFGFIFLRSQSADSDSNPASGDAAGDLARTLEANRNEYTSRINELKKSLEAYKADNSASQENEAIRQEIGRLRSELAGLRGAVAQR